MKYKKILWIAAFAFLSGLFTAIGGFSIADVLALVFAIALGVLIGTEVE